MKHRLDGVAAENLYLKMKYFMSNLMESFQKISQVSGFYLVLCVKVIPLSKRSDINS